MEDHAIKPNSSAGKRSYTLADAALDLDEEKLYLYTQKLKLEQNLPLALISGIGVVLLGTAIWTTISVSTGFQFGFMAVAVGLAVAYATRATGKGIDKIYGITGLMLSVTGLLLGNFFSTIGIAANAEGLTYLEFFSKVEFNVILKIMIESFSPVDLIFNGIAIYIGYQFSFRKISQKELVENAMY